MSNGNRFKRDSNCRSQTLHIASTTSTISSVMVWFMRSHINNTRLIILDYTI